jgi:hypothetical protein
MDWILSRKRERDLCEGFRKRNNSTSFLGGNEVRESVLFGLAKVGPRVHSGGSIFWCGGLMNPRGTDLKVGHYEPNGAGKFAVDDRVGGL